MNVSVKTITLNLLFWPLFFLVTVFGIPCLTACVLLRASLSSHRVRMRVFRRMIVWYGRMVLACMFPLVRIRRQRPSAPDPQPCIYICNHVSALDPFLMALLPGEFIQIVNIWPFKIPVLGWFARWAGYLSVREMPFEEFSSICRQDLEQGISIAAFPEGTRAGEGPMGPFHSAMFRVALETGVPVVPVCITGNERIPPKGSWGLHPGRIRVHILPPVTRDVYGEWSPFKFKTEIHQRIRREVTRVKETAT